MVLFLMPYDAENLGDNFFFTAFPGKAVA